jgi:hypothetical protein
MWFLLWPQKFEAMNRPTIANFQDDLRMGLWHLNWHHSDETDPVPFFSRDITVFELPNHQNASTATAESCGALCLSIVAFEHGRVARMIAIFGRIS